MISFKKFFIWFTALQLIFDHCKAYIYPICTREGGFCYDHSYIYDQSLPGLLSDDAAPAMIRNFIMPLNCIICAIVVSFVDVYNCVKAKLFEPEEHQQSKGLFASALKFVGVQLEQEDEQCSYHSMIIAAGTVTLVAVVMIGTRLLTDQLQESVKEQRRKRNLDFFNRKCNSSNSNKSVLKCNCSTNPSVDESAFYDSD